MGIEEHAGDSRRLFFTRMVLLSAAALYLYFNLFVWLRTPILLTGDQMFFWMNGQRILYGELPYRDFFQFTPPGADLVYFFVFKTFGPRIWVVDVVVLVVGVALCWVCFEIGRRILSLRFAALAALLFLTLIYSQLLNATHHWFSVLSILITVVIIQQGITNRRLAWAGMGLGIACFFTQTHAIVALLAILWFLWHAKAEAEQSFRRSATVLLCAFALTWLTLNAYFIVRAGLGRMLYCQVYYVLRVMVHRPETPLLGMPGLWYFTDRRPVMVAYEYAQLVFVYALLPLTYGLCLYRNLRRSNPAFARREVTVVAILGAALLAELAFSLNWLRLYAVSLPGIVLFMYLIESAKSRRVLSAAAAIGVVVLATQHVFSAQTHNYVAAELPAGRCAIESAQLAKLSWLTEHTSAGEFLFAANWPGVYIPLAVRNPVFLDTAGTWFNVAWDQEAVQQLRARPVHYVLWAGRFESLTGTASAHIAPLRSYLHENYQKVWVFADGEQVWEKK